MSSFVVVVLVLTLILIWSLVYVLGLGSVVVLGLSRVIVLGLALATGSTIWHGVGELVLVAGLV